MAGITLAQAEARLTAYLDAEAKVLTGQTVEIDGHRITRANLDIVQRGIDAWDARVKQLAGAASGRGRAVRVAAWD